MGKKTKKSAEHKDRVAAKQTKKSAQKEKRSKAKGKDADSDAEDADLDAILAQYAEEQAKFLKVTEIPSEPPVPRSSSTVLASPSNRNELLLFGGEYFDGTHAIFFNNLFVYLIDRGEWREVTSPNSPLPRSGHAWCRGGNSGGIYMFGGKIVLLDVLKFLVRRLTINRRVLIAETRHILSLQRFLALRHSHKRMDSS